ncbi:hypothetical protein TEA_014437 [Camellia sinensis var. sinensis]|uniref:PPM-type phosphatase domain-containing protein n=1 Tax=Camellia sinensis var. sinensis TaxID=542762 RepID=A0A4S4DYJ4_CAMSN|nr:hypothetical protein TEA_014437 [Camellia sinensis var. sinensis]
MGFKDLHLKLKAFQLKKFLTGGVGKKKSQTEFGRRPSWMVPVTHGYQVVDDRSKSNGELDLDSNSDSVVVQREQIEELELWFFGVFDDRIGDGVTKYLQSHLFDMKPKEGQLTKKSKETMRKAYLSARAKMREAEQVSEETKKIGSASALVIHGEKLVIANMGDYRAVVCRDGVLRIPKVRILACDSGNTATTKSSKSSELMVGEERIDSDTELVILASTGIWEVMKHQEAVNLIRHMEDPQEAAECLAKEALARRTKTNISCLVIRFD